MYVISSFPKVSFYAGNKRWVDTPNMASQFESRDTAVIASWSVAGDTVVMSVRDAQQMLDTKAQPWEID